MLQICFLLYLFMVSRQVTGINYTYWAFMPKPPINTAVSLGDKDIPVVVNQSSWIPSPYDNRGPSQSTEEGRVIDNYTVGVQGIPIAWEMEHSD